MHVNDYKKSQFNLVSYEPGLQSVEERLVHYKKNEAVFLEKVDVLNLKVRLRDNAIDVYTKNLEKAEKERDELKLTLEKYQNLSKSLNTLLESQVNDHDKTRLGYKAASPGIEKFTVESKVESVVVKNKGVCSTIETKPVRKNNFSLSIIEDWISNDESEVEFEPKVKDKTVRPCTENIKFVKPASETEEKLAMSVVVLNIFSMIVIKREDRLKPKELMELSTKLSDRVLDLEKTKTAQAKKIANLKKNVKKLERKRRPRTRGMNLFKIAKVNAASEYGYYCLKSMIEDKLQLGD
nr:hypothetical protein [Tanacetum cinerariifolium]